MSNSAKKPGQEPDPKVRQAEKKIGENTEKLGKQTDGGKSPSQVPQPPKGPSTGSGK